jgi:acetylglutamate kinase
MRRGHGAPTVLKFGGELLEDPAALRLTASMLAKAVKTTPLVVVHGGGREIDATLVRAGIKKQQVDGLRITDEATLGVVVSVLAGTINTRFVAALTTAGVPAVGLTGADAAVCQIQRASPMLSASGTQVDLGAVGEPVGTRRPELLSLLCAKGYVPVVASVAVSGAGELLNVNADTLAGYIAATLKSPRLVVAGATAGVLDGSGATIHTLSVEDIDAMVAAGRATAGMIAKLAAARKAIEGGAREVFIADGRNLDALARIVRHGRAPGAAACTQILARPVLRGSAAGGSKKRKAS